MTLLFVAGAAVAKLVRLLSDDRVPFAPVRRWLEDHWSFGHELVTCPWCVSGWLAMGATGVLDGFGSVPVPVLSWLAVWWLGCVGYFVCELLAASADQ